MNPVTIQDVRVIAHDLLNFQGNFTTLEVKLKARLGNLWATQFQISKLVNQLYDESTNLDRSPSPCGTHQVYTRRDSQSTPKVNPTSTASTRMRRDYKHIQVVTSDGNPNPSGVGVWEFYHTPLQQYIYVDGKETHDAARSTIGRYIRSKGFPITTAQVKAHRAQ